jgi:hypothetical protein
MQAAMKRENSIFGNFANRTLSHLRHKRSLNRFLIVLVEKERLVQRHQLARGKAVEVIPRSQSDLIFLPLYYLLI